MYFVKDGLQGDIGIGCTHKELFIDGLGSGGILQLKVRGPTKMGEQLCLCVSVCLCVCVSVYLCVCETSRVMFSSSMHPCIHGWWIQGSKYCRDETFSTGSSNISLAAFGSRFCFKYVPISYQC